MLLGKEKGITKELICGNCNSDLRNNHSLIDTRVPVMSNGDKIIAPVCKKCGARIIISDKDVCFLQPPKLYLISGPCGAGKSTIGQLISKECKFIHIDGDAVSKRINWDIRNGILKKREEYLVYTELWNTIITTLMLGYSVVSTYVFDDGALRIYKEKCYKMGIELKYCFLLPRREICMKRDVDRECWTAGEEMIDKWYEEQMLLAQKDAKLYIDSSESDIEETLLNVKRTLGFLKNLIKTLEVVGIFLDTTLYKRKFRIVSRYIKQRLGIEFHSMYEKSSDACFQIILSLLNHKLR